MPYSIRPRECDTLCPDRFPCYGWRQICKGGYVLWYRRRYYHDDLKQWAGMFVYVRINDWLAGSLEIDEMVSGAMYAHQKIIAEMESDADYRARKGIVIPKELAIQDGLEIQDPAPGVGKILESTDQ